MPFFENRTLSSLTRADVNEYIDQKMAEGLAPRTLDAHLTYERGDEGASIERAFLTTRGIVTVPETSQ